MMWQKRLSQSVNHEALRSGKRF